MALPVRFIFLLDCVFAAIPIIFTAKDDPVPYTEGYINQYIDHFNFKSYGQSTFAQRYLIQDKWWNRGVGPIFYYAGNEGPIDVFWDNTGFMFDLAPQFGALVLFGEHRYYGKSLPFGNQSFTGSNIGFLTMEQALADHASLIVTLKARLNATTSSVIAFGGSYGGMLSAYLRFKYPNVVQGSIASSAPIYMLDPAFDRNFFFSAVTKDFDSTNPKCVLSVRQAFITLDTWAAQGQTGYQNMQKTFHLCDVPGNSSAYRHLLGWIRNSFTYLAMLDYPYPTNFMGPLPGNPVQVACNKILTAADPVSGLAAATEIFYPSVNGSCNDIWSQFIECADPTGCGLGPDSLAWDYQACTEIPLPEGSNNVTDMFPVLPWTQAMRASYCMQKWGVMPRNDWSGLEFWGQNIKAATNIIFANGDLDPWRGGGVQKSVSSSVLALLVKGGAHHLDLRSHNDLDPIGVIEVREQQTYNIRFWVNSAQG